MNFPHYISDEGIKQIKSVLKDVCGASDDQLETLDFHFLNGSEHYPREYRFQGNLGFGGKIYITKDKLYVSCYPEDHTPERLAIIQKANWLLSLIYAPR